MSTEQPKGPSEGDDPYADTVQLLRDAGLNQEAAARVMFAGRPVDTDPEVLSEPAVAPEEFRALAATGRQSEDVALRALVALAEQQGPRTAQRAIVEAGADWLWVLLRAFETVLTDERSE